MKTLTIILFILNIIMKNIPEDDAVIVFVELDGETDYRKPNDDTYWVSDVDGANIDTKISQQEFDEFYGLTDDEEEYKNNSNVDLSIELENILRSSSDLKGMTVDSFLAEFGVTSGMTNFAWASILKNKQKYEEMTDTEFQTVYDNYVESNEFYNN